MGRDADPIDTNRCVKEGKIVMDQYKLASDLKTLFRETSEGLGLTQSALQCKLHDPISVITHERAREHVESIRTLLAQRGKIPC